MPYELIDIGANLTHGSFDHDRAAVIARAREAGVHTMIVTGSDVACSRHALELAMQWPESLRATAGIHPHHASGMGPEDMAALGRLFESPLVVAAGECGLDYFRNFSPHAAQETCFQEQLVLAADCAMPVFMHQRDAHDAFLSILAPMRDRIGKAVVHCFTGSREELHAYLDLDLHIGITGWICDERRGHHLREFVNDIPADRLMLETDSPYLLPRDLSPKPKSRRNEPVHLPHILETLATCRGVDSNVLAEQTTNTARDFFGIN